MDNISNISRHINGKTRLFTAENVYGLKGRGGMAEVTDIPQPETIQMGQEWSIAQKAAQDLGQKWKVRPSIELLPNVETNLMDVEAQGKITHIWMTCDNNRFRDIILRMYWDNEEIPSVEVPIGEFFCCGWNRRLKILSIPINVNPKGGMNCYFPMPFRAHGRITVENRSCEKVSGFFYAITMMETEISSQEAYFHASFRRTNPLKYGEDFVMIDGIKGKGHYVGTQMCWQQNNNGWWGEGEIKAFIDGDKEFPSYCGTGTEDYFGGAWCFGENYSAPYMGYQSLATLDEQKGYLAGGRHSMYRFHVLDPICFEKDLKIVMQAIGWRSRQRYLPLMDDISAVVYWYQSEPHSKFEQLGSTDDLEVI